MYVVSQFRRQINEFISASTPAAFLLAWLFLVLALACFGSVFFFMGAPAMNGRAWDTPLFLDAAWRMANGQIPHRDFYSFTGDLPFYMTWLGMKMSRPCVSAITYGNALLMTAVGLSAMAFLRRRTSALYALAMSLFLAVLAVTPRPLGDPYDYTDYAMLYNRYGEGFIGLYGAILFLRPTPGLGRSLGDWGEAVFAGALLTILLFCKVNYFFVGVGFLLVACLLGRFSLGKTLVCLLSAVVSLIVIFKVTHIPASALLQDYQFIAAAQGLRERLRVFAVHSIESVFYLPVLALLVWEMASKPEQRCVSLEAFWRPALLIVAIFGGALFLLSTNTQQGEMPLLAVAGLCGAEVIRRNPAATQEDSLLVTVRTLGGAALFALLLVPTFATDCKTVLFAARDAVKANWVSTDTLRSTQLNDFRFVNKGMRFLEMQTYMEFLDDGIQLLHRHPDPQMRLAIFTYSNPYHLALGLTPAEGGVVGVSRAAIAKRSHPSLKRMMGNATHVVVDEDGCAVMKEAYGAEWDALHLEIVEKTRRFTLLKMPEVTRNKL